MRRASERWIAFRALAIRRRPSMRQSGRAFVAGDLARGIQHRKNEGFSHVIVDVQAFSSVLHQTNLTQDHQLLRNVCLAQSERRFQMADAGLAIAQAVEQFQPRRMFQDLEKTGL